MSWCFCRGRRSWARAGKRVGGIPPTTQRERSSATCISFARVTHNAATEHRNTTSTNTIPHKKKTKKRTLTDPAGTDRRPATRAPSSARRTLSDAAPVGFHPPCLDHAPDSGACRRRCAGDQGGRERADSSAGRGGAAWTDKQNDNDRDGERYGRGSGQQSISQHEVKR